MARQSALPRRTGRPRLIDAPCPGHHGRTYAEVILLWIRDGAPLHLAARAAGINDGTLRGWRHEGREGGDPRYVAFLADCEQAEAEGAMELLARIRAAGLLDWRASLALLERRFNDDFGRHRIYRDAATMAEQVEDIDQVAEALGREWAAYELGRGDAARARADGSDSPGAEAVPEGG